jgi:hypothetical protein
MHKAIFRASMKAIALFGVLASCQCAHADELSGKMVDDSGLVITSNADGSSLKEFYMGADEKVAITVLQLKTLALGPILGGGFELNRSGK